RSTGIVRLLFFLVTASPAVYTLSLHDALPIFGDRRPPSVATSRGGRVSGATELRGSVVRRTSGYRAETLAPSATALDQKVTHEQDRKSTRLNSSHVKISYAVFCLKKKTLTDAL